MHMRLLSRKKVNDLFSMGYGKVYLTADHGFVITGILDEADKIPVPDGDIIKFGGKVLSGK